MRLVFIAIFVVILGLAADPGSATIYILDSPLWKEIPGTEPSPDSGPEYSYSASVDLNSLNRKGDLITYDLVNADAGYARMQTNCKTRQSRAIRQGSFESSSRVNFASIKGSWSSSEDAYKKAITLFICKKFR